MLHAISLGAGVQSSTMALMFANGELTPMPDCAIFADTQSEPASVYSWLDWLTTQLPFPVYRVTAGNLETTMLRLRTSQKTGNRYLKSLIPAFFKSDRGGGLMGRRCTTDFKLRPLQKLQRKLAKIPRGSKEVHVISYLGISWDEVHRMKRSKDSWNELRYPLIDARITRADCLDWMQRNGYPRPPRSACHFCPFHSDAEWIRMRKEEPHEFARAVKFDYELRELARQQTGTARLQGDVFLHSSMMPLDLVQFGDSDKQLDMFGNECEGMCGV